MSTRSARGARIAISSVAGILLVGHLIWPQLKVDAVALGLFIAAALPWLSDLVRSAKLPGGWEITFQDLKEAGARVVESEASSGEGSPTPEPALVSGDRDPNLALVSFRIELEKRLRAIAERKGLRPQRGLRPLIGELRREGVLTSNVTAGLDELVAIGNQAAHGATVEPSAADWAIRTGPNILRALDAHLE